MPVKKRKPKARQHVITDQVVALFRKCCEIQKYGDEEFWAEDGGRRREYLNAKSELDSLLHLRPWEVSPVDVNGPECPRAATGNLWSESWPRGWAIRRDILAAMKRGAR